MPEPTPDVVVVTGATSGIGLQIAREFAAAGSSVIGIARTRSDAFDALVGTAAGAMPRFFAADVSDVDALAAVAQQLSDDGVTPRVVVAAAGVNVRKPALEIEPEEIDHLLSINVKGVFSTFRAFAPAALSAPSSRFIAIGSVSGSHGMQLRAVYSATKSAISGLVRSLSIEWTPRGATVNCVAPGLIETPLTGGYLEKNPHLRGRVIEATPAGRIGTAEDVSNVVSFLASERSGFITGQTIGVDGGFGMGNSWW